MIVADANLIIYRHVDGPLTSLAAACRSRDPDWRTTALWRYEFTSALVKMVRGRILDEGGASAALAAAGADMAGREMDVPQDRAMRVALASGVSAYDAQYLALAEILGVPCVTADASLARKAPALSIRIEDYVK